MAEKIISHDDIFESGIATPVKAEFDALNETLKITAQLIAGIKGKAAGLKGGLGMGADPKSLGDVEAIKKTTKATDELTKVQEKLIATQKIGATVLAAYNIRVQEQAQWNKISAQVNETQVGSIARMRAELKQITLAWTKTTDATQRDINVTGSLAQQKRILTEQLKRLESTTGDNTRNVGNYEKATVSLRQELKNITQQLLAMQMAGDTSSKKFQELAVRGGQLKDTMSDVSARMKVLGSDTKHIDMAVGGFMALGSAVQVAEGTMQLFGSENENITRGIQKLVAIQSIMTGVQKLANAFQKESAFMLGIAAAKTYIAAAAQKVYTFAIGASTTALKVFRVALITTGIGALIAGVGLLISALMSGTDKLNKDTEATDKNARSKRALQLALEDLGEERLVERGLLSADEAEKNKLLRHFNEQKLQDIENFKDAAIAINNDKELDYNAKVKARSALDKKFIDESSLNHSIYLTTLALLDDKAETIKKEKAEAARKAAAEAEEARLASLKNQFETQQENDIKFAKETIKRVEDSAKSKEEIEIESYEKNKGLIESGLADKETKDAALEALELEHMQKMVKIGADKYDELAAITKKATDKAAEEAKKLREEELKEIKKQNEEALKAANELNDAIFDGLEQRNEREKQLNQDKISELDKQIQFQQGLAIAGEANTHAALQKERAKAMEEKAKLEARAAKRKEAEQIAEMFLEFIKVYLQTEKNPASAAAKALAQTLIAKGISKAIAGAFAEGTEDLKGAGTETSDSNIALLSKGESVLTAKGTRETSGLATAINKEGFLGAQDWAMKNVFPKLLLQDKSKGEQVNNAMLTMVHSEIKGLRKDLSGKGFDFEKNVLGEFIAIEKKMGITNETTYKKVSPSYSKH